VAYGTVVDMTNRIDHSGHNHPATPAGRAECRKALANSEIKVGDRVWAKMSDGPETEGVVVAIEPWGREFRYQCRFASGWVFGTCRVRKV